MRREISGNKTAEGESDMSAFITIIIFMAFIIFMIKLLFETDKNEMVLKMSRRDWNIIKAYAKKQGLPTKVFIRQAVSETIRRQGEGEA